MECSMTENGLTHDVAMGGFGSLVLFLLISVWVKGIASDTLFRVGSEINCNIFLDIIHLSVTMKLKKRPCLRAPFACQYFCVRFEHMMTGVCCGHRYIHLR